MATLTASAAQSVVPAKYAVNGVISRVVAYSVGATGAPNLSAGDVIQMLRVPQGACILNVNVIVDALTGGNYTIGVGDGGATGRYFSSLSTGSTSALYIMTNAASPANSVGYSYSVEDTIDILVSTVTTATAAGVLKLLVSYTLDNA